MKATSIVTVVPFFNRRHTILATLNRIRLQTVRPAQLIVVDDGSSDGGGELVRQWIDQVRGSLNSRLVRQVHSGAGIARNYGLSQCGPSEFVAFLDSDDLWPADFLERTLAAHSAHEGAVAATCDQRIVFAEDRPTESRDCSGLSVTPSLWMLEFGAGVASSTLFRRRAIERRGGFPPLLSGEDAALFLPLSLDGRWLHVPGEPVTFHRGLARRLGDEGNLSLKFADNHRMWAKIHEEFFTIGDGRALAARPECKQLMAAAWYRAGKELCQNQAPREALECFRKSWAWNPWRRRCGFRIVRTWIKTLGRRGATCPSERLATAAM